MFDRVAKFVLEHGIVKLDRVSQLDKPGLEHGIVFGQKERYRVTKSGLVHRELSDSVTQCGEDKLEHRVPEFEHGVTEFGIYRVTEERKT